ncbi:zinc ABC transporter substrate-binding protein [Sulfitobacter sp. S190]|uniref:zinc ABC transporter substrate-binding protein n=1 Tax=Sulfitobacter sp. S190 TaxID=2867022 RepID=UPI0021A88AED|nr:zinc ABC transporter substrate-binding protein [Sulfitobacter sp. S190]
MTPFLRAALAGFTLSTQAVAADVPKVVTDIAPVAAIVARVMDGVGTPEVLVQPGTSPHDYAMRPSDARALGQADMVVWIGPSLTGWMRDPIETLGADATTLTLLEVEGTQLLEFRTGVTFEAHDHGHGEGAEGHDGHEDHGDHADHEDHEDHGDHKDHDDHGDHEAHGADEDHAVHEDHADHGDHHGHDGVDPHAWLDPVNGAVWAASIAQALSEQDPQNAQTYTANAQALQAELETLRQTLAEELAPVQDVPFLVLHDAFHYFEARFGIEAVGAVSLGDAVSPGPARVQALRDALSETPVRCAFAEPQIDPALLQVAVEGHDTAIGTLDPLGGDSYVGMLRNLGQALVACLGGQAPSTK